MIIKVICRFPMGELKLATANLQDDSGNWQNKVVGLSPLSRNIGEDKSYEVSGMSIQLNDTDRFFRTMMSGEDRYIVGKKVDLYDAADRLIYTGTVDKWKFKENKFELYINDKLAGMEVLVPDIITPTHFPDMTPEADGKSIPIVYGDIQAPNGAVKCWKVTNGRYLLAGHHCLTLEGVFKSDGTDISASFQMVNTTLSPEGTNLAYVDYTGTDPFDDPFILVNVKGKADAGILIEDPVTAITDLLVQLNARRPGTAISFDTEEMTRVQTIMKNRNYKIAAAIDKGQTLNRVLMDFCFSFDCDYHISRGNELVLSMLNWSVLESAKQFTPDQVVEFQIDELSEGIRNKVYYDYHYHFAEDRFQKTPVYSKQGSIDSWGEFFIPNQPLELTYVADDVTAQDVVQRYLIQRKNPRRISRIKLPLAEFVGLDISDVIEVWHPYAIDEHKRKYQLRRIHIDFLADTVDVEAVDVTYMTGGVFILGDRSALPRFWNNTAGTQRDYGYLAEKSDGFFSNDTDNGKGLY